MNKEHLPINAYHKPEMHTEQMETLYNKIIHSNIPGAKKVADYYKANFLIVQLLSEEDRPPIETSYAYAAGITKAIFGDQPPQEPKDEEVWKLYKSGAINSEEMMHILHVDYMHVLFRTNEDYYSSPFELLQQKAADIMLQIAQHGDYSSEAATDMLEATVEYYNLIKNSIWEH